MHSFFDLTYFREVGQKYKNIFVRFLVQIKTSKSYFEINWPLVVVLDTKRRSFNGIRDDFCTICSRSQCWWVLLLPKSSNGHWASINVWHRPEKKWVKITVYRLYSKKTCPWLFKTWLGHQYHMVRWAGAPRRIWAWQGPIF